ncbi:hypothetical protein [Chitinilyticum piscinae]|uniref:Uncharacterized protein n=1 Tax=Chitinilyticum piscinae TaxID=2866724 RepID=A0A8J7KFV4_9NEIS|nr:hypothetical protein [Chitinilyticum piscinae]MBE9610119.1 hypothetical protein [Chitinilyticum piscinae]
MARPALLVICQPDIGALLTRRWENRPPDAQWQLCSPEQLPGQQADALLLVQQPLAMALAMAATCQLPCADVALLPNPAAAEYGFMLAAGGQPAALDLFAPLLDTLAPLPQGWLHSGPIASASFCGELVLRLGSNGLAPLLAGLSQQFQAQPLGSPTDQQQLLLALQQFMGTQLDSLRSLRMLAEHYLQQTGDGMQPFVPHHHQTRQFGLYAESASQSPAAQLARLLLAILPAGQ